jgi:O-antigen ligase
VTQGIKIGLHHPVQGVGIGGFKRAYANRVQLPGKEPKKAASHNTAVTVFAESGLPGLGLLVWLVGAALFITVRRATGSFRGRACLVFAAGLAAIALHALFYNALFEDPMFWGLLGLAALCSELPVRRRQPPVIASRPAEPSEPVEKVTA